MQTVPPEVQSAFDRKVAYLKEIQSDVSANSDVYQDDQGRWLCHYGCHWNTNWGLICLYPDGRCFETHGLIGIRWHEVQDWIGLPVSDEEADSSDFQISHFEHGDIRWSRTDDRCEILATDKRNWYNYRHNELLGYLKESLEIVQPQRHEEALQAIQAKCREDQFDIVLLGEFQDGKSTTLDVLCNGRELSPQGDGIKSTSAVPVSIEATRPECAPDGMSEWAELKFKTDSQIKEEIFDTFEVLLRTSESNVADDLKRCSRLDGETDPKKTFCETFDLRNAEHMGILRRLTESAWGVYAKDKGLLSTHFRQQLEILSIYLKYFGSSEYNALVERTILPVPEAGRYVLFPQDWLDRTPSALDFDLTFDECVFAFLDSAILHIKSSILSQLNCRVTDCPGIGASAYDNAVARNALGRADGVWFVKKCEKQLSASDLGTIFELIKGKDRLGRTGMALNLWKPHKTCLEDDPEKKKLCTVNLCKTQLRKDGYSFPVFWCNVRLAYLAALGKRKIEERAAFLKSEREKLMEIVDEDERDDSWSDEDLWIASVKAANQSSKVLAIKHIEEFGSDAVDLLWHHSNMDTALAVMARIVLEQKGEAILIANGSRKALDTLKTYESELEIREKRAKDDASMVARELESSRDRMQKFKNDATAKRRESRPFGKYHDGVVNELASEFVRYILGDDFQDEFAERCAVAIHDLNRSIHWTEESFKSAFDSEMSPRLQGLIEDRYHRYSEKIWKPSSTKPKVCEFFANIEDLNKALAKLVRDLRGTGDLFPNIPPPQIGKLEISQSGMMNILESLKPVCEELRQGFWGDLLELLKRVFTVGISCFFGKSRKEIVADAKRRIRPEIEAILVSDETRGRIECSVKPMFECAINEACGQINLGIQHFEDLFVASCRELEEQNRESDERKRQIAEENERIRTTKVCPLRERLEKFECSVLQELKK